MDALDIALQQAARRRALPHPAARRELRNAAGLSQADVAAVLGVTGGCISRWEAGSRSPRPTHVGRYLHLLEPLAVEVTRTAER